MAGKDTSLTYSLYGKDVSASGAMRKVGNETESVGHKFSKMAKVAAASLAIAGAAAAKFAYDAVQAAAEDQKSQKQLALALTNTTKATAAQVKGSEDFITKLQMTYGIADDKLRPALATLARGTGNLTESQKLLGLAMDVSAGTGKDLGAVSMALVRAHGGNLGALKRLGIPLSDNIIKTKDFNAASKVLATTFGGAAKTNAESFNGKMEIMRQRLQESKEQIGYALMPMLQKFAGYVLKTVVPNVQGLVDGLTGVKNSSGDAAQSAYHFGQKVKSVIKWIADHQGVVKTMAILIGSMFVGLKVGGIISALGTLAAAFAPVTVAAATAASAEAAATGGLSLLAAAPAIAAIAAVFGVGGLLLLKSGGKGAPAKHGSHTADIGHGIHGGRGGAGNHTRRAVGGSVMGRSSYYVGENGPELFTPSTSGRITPNGLGGGSGLNVVVNVHGSVIREKDLAVTVRDNIAQMMRRQGLNPSILGV